MNYYYKPFALGSVPTSTMLEVCVGGGDWYQRLLWQDRSWSAVQNSVRHHISDRWGVMYVERWLKAPVQMLDRSIQKRTRGTPQGGASVRYWIIYSCTMPLTYGCSDIMEKYRLNGTPTMQCATATVARRLGRWWSSCGSVLHSGYCCGGWSLTSSQRKNRCWFTIEALYCCTINSGIQRCFCYFCCFLLPRKIIQWHDKK